MHITTATQLRQLANPNPPPAGNNPADPPADKVSFSGTFGGAFMSLGTINQAGYLGTGIPVLRTFAGVAAVLSGIGGISELVAGAQSGNAHYLVSGGLTLGMSVATGATLLGGISPLVGAAATTGLYVAKLVHSAVANRG